MGVMMDEICEDTGAYHSKDMVTVHYDGADKPGTILCGYHELRRHMAQARLGRLAAADALMAAHLAKLAAAERGSAEYVERNNHATR